MAILIYLTLRIRIEAHAFRILRIWFADGKFKYRKLIRNRNGIVSLQDLWAETVKGVRLRLVDNP